MLIFYGLDCFLSILCILQQNKSKSLPIKELMQADSGQYLIFYDQYLILHTLSFLPVNVPEIPFSLESESIFQIPLLPVH